MDLLQIIIKPYLTEKSFSIREKNKREVITFVVHPKATKHDIKKAFMLIYQIKPDSINTITHKPAEIKTGTKVPGMTKLTKIAYITLPEGTKLAVTKEEIEAAKEDLKKETTVVTEKEANALEKAEKKLKAQTKKKDASVVDLEETKSKPKTVKKTTTKKQKEEPTT